MSEHLPSEQGIHTDAQIIERWLINRVRQIPRKAHTGEPLWFVVAEEFAIGSTLARQLCRRHCVDPEILVRHV